MTRKYILGSLNLILLIIFSFIYILGIHIIGIYSKRTTIILTILVIIISITLSKTYLTQKKNIYNIGIFCTFLLNIILIYNIATLNYEYNYISNIFSPKYTYNEYNLYTSKKNPTYSDIVKLNNKKIGLLTENSTNITSHIDKTITVEYKLYTTIEELEEALYNSEVQAIILSEEQSYHIKDTKLESETRIIYQNKIKNTI